MAKRGTLIGELEARARGAWLRFWRLPWRWKGPVIGLVAGFVLISAISPSPDVEDGVPVEADGAGMVSASEEEVAPSSTAMRTTPATSVPTARPTASPTDTPTPASTEGPPDSIPGLEAADVTRNLEEHGFDCKGPTQLQTMVSYYCEDSADDGRWSISVSMLAKDSRHIRSIDATVFDFSGEPATEMAVAFHAFRATIPYDGADQEVARAWVEAHPNEDASAVFGSATYAVFGPVAARTLEIVAVGAR